ISRFTAVKKSVFPIFTISSLLISAFSPSMKEEITASSTGAPQPPYVLPSKSFGDVIFFSTGEANPDVLCWIIAPMDTIGTSCTRASVMASCALIPKSALPAATSRSAPVSPGIIISTSKPSSLKYPFSWATYKPVWFVFGVQSSTIVTSVKPSSFLLLLSSAPQPASNSKATKLNNHFFILFFPPLFLEREPLENEKDAHRL